MTDLDYLLEQVEAYAEALQEKKRIIAGLEAERDALKHDIARHVAIASEEATRADGLQSGIDRMLSSILAVKKRALQRLDVYSVDDLRVLFDMYRALQSGSQP